MSDDERLTRWLSGVSRELRGSSHDDDGDARTRAQAHLPETLVASWLELGVTVEQVLQLIDRSGLLRWLVTDAATSEEHVSRAAAELADRIRQRETAAFSTAVLNLRRQPTIEAATYGDWEVWLPDADELAALAPIPLVAQHARAHVWPFESDLHTDLVLLRSRPQRKPMPKGVFIKFDLRWAPWMDAWRPLLMFNLFVAEAAIQTTQHGWVHGRYGSELHGSLPTEPATFDGETFDERPLTAPWFEDDGPGGHFANFARLLDNQIDHLRGKVRDVIERASKRFLTASATCLWDGTAPADLTGQVVADYVSVLEALTVADADRTFLAHKTGQHVAVLCAGEQDDVRLDLFQQVKRAYAARSAYAHGGEVTDPLDVVELRRLVQRTLIRFIVVAASSGTTPVAQELPRAVLSPTLRRDFIDKPVSAFVAELSGENQGSTKQPPA